MQAWCSPFLDPVGFFGRREFRRRLTYVRVLMVGKKPGSRCSPAVGAVADNKAGARGAGEGFFGAQRGPVGVDFGMDA